MVLVLPWCRSSGEGSTSVSLHRLVLVQPNGFFLFVAQRPPRIDPRLEHNSAYDHKQEIGVIDVALLGIIRRWHLRDQVPLREIARRLGISRNTVRRYIRAETIEPAYADRRPRSSLDRYTLKLSAWLKTEAVKSRKQRRTLKQLHLELRSLGYEGSYDRVAAFARRWKVDQLERVNSASKSTAASQSVLGHAIWKPFAEANNA